jgi:hypothetical protein
MCIRDRIITFKITSVNFQYKRVNRRRTCLICGKPDWCSYTPDSRISFCARIITDADRVSRTGWGVFYHEKSKLRETSVPFPICPPTKKAELAPIEIRDFVYRKLISLSPATESDAIINGPKGLRSRKILDFENYGSLPQNQNDRRKIAKIIRTSICRQFPEYVRTQRSAASGLPGFWFNKNDQLQIWREKDFNFPMLLIPYRDEFCRIQACQIRFMGQHNRLRYLWFSTPEKSGSVSSGSPLHFARYNSGIPEIPFLITEGALKAATTQFFKSDFNILAVGGVTCQAREIIRATRFHALFLAFDGDGTQNLFVARSILKLIKLRFQDSQKYQYQPRIKILTWDRRVKGIDDALLRNLAITEISPSQWYESLSISCRNSLETENFSPIVSNLLMSL